MVSDSIRQLADYEYFLRSGKKRDEEAEFSMIKLCSNIVEFQARAACHLQKNVMESTIRNAFKLDEWDRLLSTIKRSEIKVKDFAGRKQMHDILDLVEEREKEIKTEDDRYRRERVDALLRLLYDNASSYEDSKNRNRERVTGTCDWFTNHHQFKDWNFPSETNQGAPGLLYVTADPGCGKSVLSRYLIDEVLPDDGRTVCYFFFKDDFEQQKTSTRAICTLLHQLLCSNRHLVSEDLLEKHGARGKKFSRILC